MMDHKLFVVGVYVQIGEVETAEECVEWVKEGNEDESTWCL